MKNNRWFAFWCVLASFLFTVICCFTTWGITSAYYKQKNSSLDSLSSFSSSNLLALPSDYGRLRYTSSMFVIPYISAGTQVSDYSTAYVSFDLFILTSTFYPSLSMFNYFSGTSMDFPFGSAPKFAYDILTDSTYDSLTPFPDSVHSLTDPLSSWQFLAIDYEGGISTDLFPFIYRTSSITSDQSGAPLLLDHITIRVGHYDTDLYPDTTWLIFDFCARFDSFLYDFFSIGFMVSDSAYTPAFSSSISQIIYTSQSNDYWTQLANSNGESYFNSGYQQGYQNGFEQGTGEGLTAGESIGYDKGHAAGVVAGIAQANDYTFGSLFSGMFDSLISTFSSLFDFKFFGYDLRQFLLSLLGIFVIVTLLRFFVK